MKLSDQHDAIFVVQGRHSADNEDPIYVGNLQEAAAALFMSTPRQFMDETVQILHDISTLKGFYDKGLVKIIQGYKKGPGKTIKTPNNCPTMSEKYQQVSAGMVGDDNMIHVMCCYVSSALHQYWPQQLHYGSTYIHNYVCMQLQLLTVVGSCARNKYEWMYICLATYVML